MGRSIRLGAVKEPPSSRTDEKAAGWYGSETPPRTGGWERELTRRVRPKWDTMSWLALKTLLESANDLFARRAPRIIRDRRARYVEGLKASDFVIDRTDLEAPRFLLVGDPGEADASQYATIDPLLDIDRGQVRWDHRRGRRSDFMVVVSDVIYPAGDVNDYVNGFYLPYRRYDPAIYALPGNHDWYDGLDGFMATFCGVKKPPKYGARPALIKLLWRRASKPDRKLLDPWVKRRPPVQRTPYWAIELKDLMLVGIDTGVDGELDADQGEWLAEISKRDKPKVLLTGKPIWVNNAYRPGAIFGSTTTVDDIVREPSHRYIAAIGGDTHNYQRYRVTLQGDRKLNYVVSGGGGAYLSATHVIPTVEAPAEELSGVAKPERVSFDEDDFACYPLRGDSLALFCRRLGPMLFKTLITLLLMIGAAAGVLALTPLSETRVLAAVASSAAVAAVLGLGIAVALHVIRNLGPAIVLAAAAAGVAALTAADDPRWTAAAIAAGGAALLAIVLVVLTYVSRGKLPDRVVDWLPVPPLVALPLVLAAPYDVGTIAAILLYGAVPLLLAFMVAALMHSLRDGAGPGRAFVYRAFTAAAWVTCAMFVLVRLGRPWMTLGLAVVLGFFVLAGVVVPRLGPGRRRVHSPRYDTVGGPAAVLAALSFAGAALTALFRWQGPLTAAVAAGGLVALPGVVATGFALYLLLVRRLINPLTFLYLRRGEISPAGAASYVAEKMGAGRHPTRTGEPLPTDARRHSMVRVIERAGKLAGPISDTNVPPFYRSFLSADVSDGKLVLRCWGVTGYDDEKRSPSLEDTVEIPLGEAP